MYGCEMFKLVKRLKALKFHMKNLNWKNGNLYERVITWRSKLQVIQTKVDADHFNVALKEAEARIMKEYSLAVQDEESFFVSAS